LNLSLVGVSSEFVLQSIVDGISLGMLYALLALGLALLFGVLGLLNWAHGDLIMAGAYVLVIGSALAAPILIPLMVVIVVVLALVMERVAFRPVRNANTATMLVTAFGVSFMLQSLAFMIFGATPKTSTLSADLLTPIDIFGLAVPKVNLVIVAIGGAFLIGLTLLLTRTRLGIQLRAAAQDFEMALLLGVKANRVIAVAFAMSGVLAATAAFLLVAQLGTVTPTFGATPVLIAFTAVIVGGMGSLIGGVVGGFIVGGLTVALQAVLPGSLDPYRDAFLFSLVLAILIVRPQGLIPDRSRIARV
jgi:branched-chain amino acid transport system permease protein